MWKNTSRAVLYKPAKKQVEKVENKVQKAVANTAGNTDIILSGGSYGSFNAVYGADISEITYFTVLRCLSEAVAKLGAFVRDKDHKIVNNDVNFKISVQPNAKDTAATLFSYLERCRNHYGNGYAYVKWDNNTGKLQGIYPLDPRRVQIWVDDTTDEIATTHFYVYIAMNGNSFMVAPEDIIHVKNWHTDDKTGLVGIPVRETLAEYMMAAKAGQQTQNDMYQQGMIANGVLNYVGDVDEDRKQKMVANIKKLGKESKIIPLPQGWQITPINLSLADQQYLETRRYTAAQLGAAFGVTPNLLNDFSKGSYANATAQQLAFLTDTLLYISRIYESELSLKLLSASELASGTRVSIDTEAILRSAPETLANTLKSYVTGSIMTINEARDKINLPPYPNGDQLMTMPGAKTVEEKVVV